MDLTANTGRGPHAGACGDLAEGHKARSGAHTTQGLCVTLHARTCLRFLIKKLPLEALIG